MIFGGRSIDSFHQLTLYGNLLPVVDSIKHVGILLNNKFKSIEKTTNACRILRSSLLSILKSGIHPFLLNPLSCCKVVFQVCYPKVLFACELWYDLTTPELLKLGRSHRFVCKTLRGLPGKTRTDKCVSLIGWLSIEAMIDKQKLQFFGRICRLNSRSLPKIVMTIRLFEFTHKCVGFQKGFIPDLMRLVRKYSL